jgi:hypothetical protein
VALIHRRDPARRMARFCAPAVFTIGAATVLAVGCARRPAPAAPSPTVRVQPPDWFHQQLAAARAARRDHQPQADTVGAQRAYDDVMRTACTKAALAGPGKYPARCDAVLHPTPNQSPTDPCGGDTDSQAMQTECSD